MAISLPNFSFPFFPAEPDVTVYDAALGGAAYVSRVPAQTRDMALRISIDRQRELLIFKGTAAPTDDSGSRLLAPGVSYERLSAGDQLFVKRVGSNNTEGSIEGWEITT